MRKTQQGDGCMYNKKTACSLANFKRFILAAAWMTSWPIGSALAQETVCASVKIEIKQELALERQAFDAEMRINNTTDTGVIENILVEVKVTDEAGTPVSVTSDPNNLSAKFFIRVSNKQNISAIDGSGTVGPRTTGVINWLLIPAPGAAGTSPLGKKYLIGATLKYKYLNEETSLDVSPDVITVKPLPALALDYFLTQDVIADDPLTAEIEPAEPFTLGVRVKNSGHATARNLTIESAQPKIIENNQGLLINFLLTGSYINDAPTQNTLLVNFGDVNAGTSKTARWNMQTTLAGKFTEFSARFTHADELGGALTSLVQGVNAHPLLRDVRVDLPGRDYVRDFLARDGDVVRVYESDSTDTEVTDRSAVATLTASSVTSANASYKLAFPATAGFAYVRIPDPSKGAMALSRIVRSDAKEVLAENVWLSKSRNAQTKQWDYWFNLFDVNTTGSYTSDFQAPPAAPLPPQIQFVPDRVTKETKQVSFLVEASSADGRPVALSAAPLPAGATFTAQADDPAAPGVKRAVLDWTPAKGTTGSYLIVYTASDGRLTSTRSAKITVEDAPPPGPGVPVIVEPLSGAQVASLKPALTALTPSDADDPTRQLQFELYTDEAQSQLVATALVDEAAAGPTAWQPPADLMDNKRYWWRVRGFDGNLYSAWANGQFFVNLYNDAPESFNLTSPAPGAETASAMPQLAWTNSTDVDGDAITYSVVLYKDSALTDVVSQATGLAPGADGSTTWSVPVELVNHAKYYWRVVATDALGSQTPTAARPFIVNTGNTAPTDPVMLSPAPGGQSTLPDTVLAIQDSSDAENDLITYVFEIDTVNTFDSANKRSSGQVIQGGAGTSWTATGLVENQRYWWRVKAQDGRAETAWVVADFLMNAANDAPPAPTIRNPGSGSWTATRQPALEANPVVEPEGEALRYHFEVYRDSTLETRVADGISTNTGLIVTPQLADKTTHWWRVRALDPHDAASAWSEPAVLYVSTAPYEAPTIAVTSPALPVVPTIVTTADGVRKQLAIHWEGTDPNIEPTIALYYDSDRSGYDGNLIVDGLRQQSGTQSGTYTWDVSALPPGAYYIYAVIYDAKGVGKAYAPGALVVPTAQQAGSIVAIAGKNLRTSENGLTTAFNVRLGSAPVADVLVPLSTSDAREGTTNAPHLLFTPKNWSVEQSVVVTGQNDCAPDRKKVYQVFSGRAVTVDPDYIGLSGKPVDVVNMGNADMPRTTSDPELHICGLSPVSERKVDNRTWEYVLRGQLTNTGAPVGGVAAHLRELRYGMQVVEGVMLFGAVGAGDTGKTTDTVTVRSRFQVPAEVFKLGAGFSWAVEVQR